MYSYIICRIQPKDGVAKQIHDTILCRQCQIMSLEIGERGWLLVDIGDDSFGPHRIALSNILNFTGHEDMRIETENTIYHLRKETAMIIIRNAIRCNICGDEIESRHRHDFVQCKCGACAVDGGHDYLRRCARDESCYTDISIVDRSREEK